jgi:drug/metabolite transporter (DMT)-like permease
MDRHRLVGIALIVISACSFGSGGVFASPVYAAGVDWMVLLAWRFLIGGAIAWAWLLLSAQRRAALRAISRRELFVTLGLGALYVGNSATYYWSLETVPVSLAALIVYIYPAVVAVLSIRFARRLHGRRPWVALAVALTGSALALGGIPSTEMPPLSGLILIVASPLIYAVWIILAARFSGERSHGGGVDSGAATAIAMPIMMVATASVYWIGTFVTGRSVLPSAIPTEAWPGILGVAVIATAVAIQAFYAGARRIGAAQASLVSTIEPVWTIALAAILLGEVLTPVQLLGGALVLVGVLVAQTGPPDERPVELELRIADE